MRSLAIISVNRDPLSRAGTPDAGGQVSYVRRLSGRLAERGWRVDIFTSQFARDEEHSVVVEDIDVYRIPIPGDVAALDADGVKGLAEPYAARAARVRPKLGYVAVLGCYWHSAPAALRIARDAACSSFITFCSLGYWKTLALGKAEDAGRLAIEADACRQFDHVIAKSNEEKALLCEHYGAEPERIHVIPNGVDLDRFFPR